MNDPQVRWPRYHLPKSWGLKSSSHRGDVGHTKNVCMFVTENGACCKRKTATLILHYSKFHDVYAYENWYDYENYKLRMRSYRFHYCFMSFDNAQHRNAHETQKHKLDFQAPDENIYDCAICTSAMQRHALNKHGYSSVKLKEKMKRGKPKTEWNEKKYAAKMEFGNPNFNQEKSVITVLIYFSDNVFL